jgi:CubicO group peptidase (beta-lactamase class C family)
MAQPNTVRISQHLRRAEALGFSGGVAVAQNGRVVLRQSYGFADRDQNRPMAPDSIFDIGSVSKQFTAAAILRLEEMGRLSVEDRITRFFPDTPADKRDITIHQLLTHSAGFPHDASQRDSLLTRREGVARILRAQLRSVPGSAHSYSNAGYTLLAAIVEIASGQGYEPFLREELWLPVGMKDTGNLLPRWPQHRYALGYNAAGSSAMPPKQWWIDDGPSWSVRGAGYILSTTGDLIRWAEALREGRILTEASRRKLFHPHIRERPGGPAFYGYGWTISSAPDGSCAIAHDGGAGFHEDILWIYPERRVSAVIFTSESRSPASRYLRTAGPLLFPTPDVRLPEAQVPLSRSQVAQLAGTYNAGGDSVRVGVTGDHLTVLSRQPGALRLLTSLRELQPEDQRIVEGTNPKIAGVFAALHRGDYAPLESLLRAGASIAEEREFWPSQWRTWQRDFGAFQGTEIIGYRRAGEDLITFVQVRFARSALPIEIIHNREGRIFIGTVTQNFPERTFLIPRRDGSFLAWNGRLNSGIFIRLDGAQRSISVQSRCFGSACEPSVAPATGN